MIESPPGRIVSGEVLFNGIDLLTLPQREMRRIRGGQIAMVFQDPLTSLNPVFTIGDQLIEAIHIHLGLSGKAARERAMEALTQVGIPDPARAVDSYPSIQRRHASARDDRHGDCLQPLAADRGRTDYRP